MRGKWLLLALAIAASTSFAQVNGSSKPASKPRKVVLSSVQRAKIRAAFEAVSDVEDLADAEIYEAETLDAKRAIREARLTVQPRTPQMYLLADIEVILLKKDACRAVSVVSDWKSCAAEEDALSSSVQARLGLRP